MRRGHLKRGDQGLCNQLHAKGGNHTFCVHCVAGGRVRGTEMPTYCSAMHIYVRYQAL